MKLMFKRVLRFIVGLIFIISGFVKAVDVKGFSFKLEEYFSPQVFNISFLEDWALPLAMVVVVLELVLGLLLLLNIQLKKVLWALIALCVFFAFLTFYSAYYNVVTDCGCFGDAIKFTPWQSFWKDMVLLGFLVWLYFLYKNQPQVKVQNYRYSFLAVGVVVSLWIIFHGLKHEPIIDFRDYKIGTDLNAERKKIEASPSEYTTFYTLKHAKTSEVIKVSQDDYINKNYWKDELWELQEDQTTSELTKQGYASEIAKLRIEDINGNDITDSLLQAPKTVLIFSYQPDKADAKGLLNLEKKIVSAKKITVYGVSTKADTYKIVPNALMDGTAIKTIARSNPFVLVLEKGVIVDKKSGTDVLD